MGAPMLQLWSPYSIDPISVHAAAMPDESSLFAAQRCEPVLSDVAFDSSEWKWTHGGFARVEIRWMFSGNIIQGHPKLFGEFWVHRQLDFFYGELRNGDVRGAPKCKVLDICRNHLYYEIYFGDRLLFDNEHSFMECFGILNGDELRLVARCNGPAISETLEELNRS